MFATAAGGSDSSGLLVGRSRRGRLHRPRDCVGPDPMPRIETDDERARNRDDRSPCADPTERVGRDIHRCPACVEPEKSREDALHAPIFVGAAPFGDRSFVLFACTADNGDAELMQGGLQGLTRIVHHTRGSASGGGSEITVLVRRDGTGRGRGQSLAEFAIIFPVLFLILASIIQFALVFWAQNTLTQVVRDVGRWEATQQLRPCDSGGPALVTMADQIARRSSLLGYTSGLWTGINGGAPFAFDANPAPREGIESSWPISSDPPGGFVNTDCPPDSNQIAWFVNIRAHHEVPLFLPLIGPFIPSCDIDSCTLSSSVQFRMEPSR